MTSIREVAAEANVSLSTVSKVLNNKTDVHISPATRERVRAAAHRIGYHPSAIARGLAGMRMNTLGLILAYDQASVTSDPYLGACLDGILDINKQRRQKTVLFTEDSWEEAYDNLPSYCDGHCDGLMLLIPRTNSAIVSLLKARRPSVPFILVGDSREDAGVVCVDVDNVRAAREAVGYLIGLGHRRIAAFCGNSDFCSSEQRLAGYRQALEEAGIPYDPEIVFPGEYWGGYGRENIAALRERFSGERASERPTAIFCFNDRIAVSTIEALADAGFAVPGEMSVMGFDDIAVASTIRPQLTTVRQNVREVGRLAANTLLDLIDGRIALGHRAWAPAEIIVRDSVAAAPSRETVR
jgi:LacI family transcriptional regulator